MGIPWGCVSLGLPVSDSCKVADIETQPHFLVTSHFVYFGLKHNVIGFLLAKIKSSDLWGGFVVSKKIITGLNNILYQFFSKY